MFAQYKHAYRPKHMATWSPRNAHHSPTRKVGTYHFTWQVPGTTHVGFQQWKPISTTNIWNVPHVHLGTPGLGRQKPDQLSRHATIWASAHVSTNDSGQHRKWAHRLCLPQSIQNSIPVTLIWNTGRDSTPSSLVMGRRPCPSCMEPTWLTDRPTKDPSNQWLPPDSITVHTFPWKPNAYAPIVVGANIEWGATDVGDSRWGADMPTCSHCFFAQEQWGSDV